MELYAFSVPFLQDAEGRCVWILVVEEDSDTHLLAFCPCFRKRVHLYMLTQLEPQLWHYEDQQNSCNP